jgi:cephalosporin-C deacetylase-like acetyl esterase
LKINDIMIGQRDEYPTFTRELIQLTWREGDPIYVFLVLPKNHPKPPVILYLYGYPSDTDRFMNEDYCALLAKDGVAAAGFLSALTGHRYHDRPMKEWFVSELQEALGTSVHDVQMVLNYLATRNDVDVSRAGMFGDGSGAAIGILAAAVEPRIKALDVTDPWGDWPDWLAKSTIVPEEERPAYLKPEFLKRVAPLDPVEWFGKVKVPVRLQYLYQPGETPLAARERIKAAAPLQAKILPQKDALAQFQADKLKYFDWIKDQLRRLPAQ